MRALVGLLLCINQRTKFEVLYLGKAD